VDGKRAMFKDDNKQRCAFDRGPGGAVLQRMSSLSVTEDLAQWKGHHTCDG
jgi:hypothetical protein